MQQHAHWHKPDFNIVHRQQVSISKSSTLDLYCTLGISNSVLYKESCSFIALYVVTLGLVIPWLCVYIESDMGVTISKLGEFFTHQGRAMSLYCAVVFIHFNPLIRQNTMLFNSKGDCVKWCTVDMYM